ncbi:S-type anion channel SLAH1-like protein [Drosera capensis]
MSGRSLEQQPPIQLVIDHSPWTSRNNQNRQSAASKRPFSSVLARLHAGYFRISLSLGGQALLWKLLTEKPSNEADHQDSDTPLLHIFDFLPSTAFLLLWCLSICILISISFLYLLRCCFHFHLVKAEFLHHVGVNYLFAPWTSWLLLLQSAPALIAPNKTSYLVLWWVFAIPIIALDIKIYGQWFTTEKRFLSMAANPTSQISVLGSLVAARAAAEMGWTETAVCMFSLGMTHYLVLFVTLYQRLSGSDRLPAMLRPVFFLFFAVPSMASLAWSSISGSYDTASKMLFSLSLFLFASLLNWEILIYSNPRFFFWVEKTQVCRPNIFKKSMRKFNVAWWAYSFPLTFLALASAEYAQEVKGDVAPILTNVLSGFSGLVFLGLMLFTVLNITKLLRENDPILSFAKDTTA